MTSVLAERWDNEMAGVPDKTGPAWSQHARECQELKTYEDAVWEFLMEHCDVLESGALFFKFHGSGRADVQRRIRARWKWGYHREDPKAKEEAATQLREVFVNEKVEKKEAYEMGKKKRKLLAVEEDRKRRAEMQVAMAKVKQWNEMPEWKKKLYSFLGMD